MADAKLVLWGEKNFYSPYVFSCWVALKEKAIPFELRTFDLDGGEHRRGDYAARSVTGRVPSLQHGERWLAESSAIDEYVEDLFPPPGHQRLYPEQPFERARARQLQAWLRSDLMPIREERPTSSVFGKAPVKPFTPAGQAAAERLVQAAEALLPQGSVDLFGGFTIADADLAMMLERLIANADPVPARIKAYAEAIWARPSIQEWRRKAKDPR